MDWGLAFPAGAGLLFLSVALHRETIDSFRPIAFFLGCIFFGGGVGAAILTALH